MEQYSINHISLNQKTLEWFREFVCESPKYLRFWKSPFIRFHFYKKYHNVEELRLGGENVIVDWDTLTLYHKLRLDLPKLNKTKFRWNRSSKYLGENEDILSFTVKNNIKKIDVTTNEDLFSIPRSTIELALEKKWVVRVFHGLKIYAIPIFLTPRRWIDQKNDNHKITNF